MKALRTKLRTYAIALLISCGLVSPAIAGSGDFAGIYGALYASAGGAEIDGTHTTGDNGGKGYDDVTKGQIGGVFPVGGYEIGFNLPLGDLFFVGVGHSWTQSGTATLARGDDNNNGGSNSEGNGVSSASYHLKAKSMKNVYIMPSISIYDNAALYLKAGRSIADLELTGGAHGTPNNLSGDTFGIGTIAMTNSGIFVKTEGSVTSFDDINIIGAAGGTALVEGNPTVVQGTIALGFKF